MVEESVPAVIEYLTVNGKSLAKVRTQPHNASVVESWNSAIVAPEDESPKPVNSIIKVLEEWLGVTVTVVNSVPSEL